MPVARSPQLMPMAHDLWTSSLAGLMTASLRAARCSNCAVSEIAPDCWAWTAQATMDECRLQWGRYATKSDDTMLLCLNCAVGFSAEYSNASLPPQGWLLNMTVQHGGCALKGLLLASQMHIFLKITIL